MKSYYRASLPKTSLPANPALRTAAHSATARYTTSLAASAQRPVAHHATVANGERFDARPQAGMRASGQPLDAASRADMESRFGHDFSGVRVHTDARATRVADAQAFTAGSHIVFAPGRYDPSTPVGRGLLAHELAHVVQQRLGRGNPDALSRPGDADEAAAHRAVHDMAEGRMPALGAARAGIHRQAAGESPGVLPARPPLLPTGPIMPQQSPAELVLESFLNRMWDAQSHQQQALRLTPNVLDGLHLILGMDAPVSPFATFASPSELIAIVRPLLRSGLAPAVQAPAALDRLVANEKPLPKAGAGPAGSPATPTLPGAVLAQPAIPAVPDPRKPQPGNNYDEAMTKALQAAFEEFRKTRIGRELEKSVKEYVFSKQGIPLVILVASGVVTFLAANDPKLPSVPEIPVGQGIKLKFDISAKGSELPPLLSDLVHHRTEPQGTPERKVMVSATFTFEALGEAAAAVGHFFAEAAVWIGKGIVKAGTVIGKGVEKGAHAVGKLLGKLPLGLLLGAGGAALGAGIGALAGGGIGALIGAGVGAVAGAGAGLLAHYLKKKPT